MKTTIDHHWRALGSPCRIVIVDTLHAEKKLQACLDWLETYEQTLSRFRPNSELSQINNSLLEVFKPSKLFGQWLDAALAAAEQTGGIVDCTLGQQMVDIGYQQPWGETGDVILNDILPTIPERRYAAANIAAAWKEIIWDGTTLLRPLGVQLDSGGVGKGLAADMLAQQLQSDGYGFVDLGGDIRCFGSYQWPIGVKHPLSGNIIHELSSNKGVATSGIDKRLWNNPDGSIGHHLIDPQTGLPVWSGIIAVSVQAETAVLAETLSKWALLTGRQSAKEILRHHHGVIVYDDGSHEIISPQTVRLTVRSQDGTPLLAQVTR